MRAETLSREKGATEKHRATQLASKKEKGFPDGSAGKESACNAGDTGDVGLIPGSGRSPGEGNAAHSSVLDWEIPWTEEPGRLQSMGSQQSDTTECMELTHKCSSGRSQKTIYFKDFLHNLLSRKKKGGRDRERHLQGYLF